MKSLDKAIDTLVHKSASQIARLVRTHGITGRPGTTTQCPLAELLHELYGGTFYVGQKSIIRQSGVSRDKLPTPEGCKDFLRRFDKSGYPDLIKPPPRVMGKIKAKKSLTRRGPRKGTKHVVRSAREVGRFG